MLQMYFSSPSQNYAQASHVLLIHAVCFNFQTSSAAANLDSRNFSKPFELVLDHLKHENLIVFAAAADTIASLTQIKPFVEQSKYVEQALTVIIDALHSLVDFEQSKTNMDTKSNNA